MNKIDEDEKKLIIKLKDKIDEIGITELLKRRGLHEKNINDIANMAEITGRIKNAEIWLKEYRRYVASVSDTNDEIDQGGREKISEIIITSELLQERGSQEDYVWAFNRHWPDGLLVSENAILEMSEKYIDITEIARALFTDKAFNGYEQLINPVQILYDEKIAIAEQAYNKALEPADKIFDEAIDRLDNECDNAIEAAEKEYRKIINGLKDVINRKIRRAMLSSAQKEYDATIEKAANIYDMATDKLEEDYNKVLGPAGQTRWEQTIEIMQLYDRTKAIAFIKSWTLKK